ncbi:hypothetical protein FA95DRAFT_1601089, partial [Auriscalpium vulgare]
MDPFLSVQGMLEDGVAHEFTDPTAGATGPAEPEEAVMLREYHVRMYRQFASQVPGFSNLIREFRENPQAFSLFVSALATAANDARMSDTGSLKKDSLSYVPRRIGDSLVPPIRPDESKASRGYNHRDTGALLLPKRYQEEYDSDPSFCDKIRDGKVKITSKMWASYLYAAHIVFDKNNKDLGLLRGYILLRFFRHIFLGPQAASSEGARVSTKPGKAKMYGLKSVTPRTIAYTAIQAYIALSDMPQWGFYHNKIDLRTLYNRIVDLLEKDPEHPWCKETMAWWNSQISLPSQTTKSAGSDSDDSDESDDDILAQFDARANEPSTRPTSPSSRPPSPVPQPPSPVPQPP